jgi:hypothetical protein
MQKVEQKTEIKLKLVESNREEIKRYIFQADKAIGHVGDTRFLVKRLDDDRYHIELLSPDLSGTGEQPPEQACDFVDQIISSQIKEGSEELIFLECWKDLSYEIATNEFTLEEASYTVYMNNEDPLDLQYELIASKMAEFDYATVFGYYDGLPTLLDYKYDFYHNAIEGDVEERPLKEVLEKEILPVVVNQIDNPDYDKVSFYIRGEYDRTLPRPEPDEDNYMSKLAGLDDD